MNNPISAGIGKLDKLYGLDEALLCLKESGIGFVDFWLCMYCDGPNAPMKKDDWRSFAERTREKIDSYGIRVGQCHAYWRHKVEIREDFSFSMPSELTLRNFEACRILGADRLVFHPLERWLPISDAETVNRVIDCNAAWFSAMVPEAKKQGVSIDVENLFDHKHKCGPDYPAFPFGRAAHHTLLYEKIGSDAVGFCLDTGHANISGADIPAAIREWGPRLHALHLNDNYGLIGPIYEDVHLFPGYGRIDWKPVFQALREIGYSGTLNMEVNGELARMPHAVRVSMLRAARETLEYFRDNY